MGGLRRCVGIVGVAAVIFLPVSGVLAKGKRGGGGGGNMNTPPAQPANSTITQDQKDLADDRAALAKATKDLNSAMAKLSADFEASPGAVAARQAVADAAGALEVARQAVLKILVADPTYAAAAAKEDTAKAALDALREKNGSPDDISAKSSEVFRYDGITSKLERAATDGDTGYQAAQSKLADANKALADLRSNFKDSLKTDATISPLQQAHDDAQAKVSAAQAKLNTDRGNAPAAAPAAAGGY